MFPKASPSSIRSVVATIACDATSTWARAFRCTGVVRSTCPVGPAAVHRISDTRWHSPISAYGCTITLLAVIHEGVATIIRHTPSPGACLRASFLAVVYASGLMQPSVFPAQPPPLSLPLVDSLKFSHGPSLPYPSWFNTNSMLPSPATGFTLYHQAHACTRNQGSQRNQFRAPSNSAARLVPDAGFCSF